MPPTVHFCGVVGGRNVDLLSRLIRHYEFLGVNGRWNVGVHMADPDDPILDRVRQVLAQFDLDVSATVVGPWRHRLNPGLIARARGMYPRDWCVIADQDEFHVFPDDITAIIDRCDSSGYQAVQGRFVDRVALNGALPAVKLFGSLWEQFPLGGDVTLGVLGECSPKTVLARGDVLIGWGNHLCFRGTVSPRELCDVAVHHFKWDGSVKERLRERHDLYTRYGEMCAHESAAFLDHVERNGRIDIDDPALRIRYIGNPYGSLNTLD